MSQKITLDHGSGGKLTLELIEEVFKSESGLDSAILGDIAFTTDSHSIKPLFFAGGDIGKLSVAGTVNDLLCVGAKPLYLSTAFIIEAGFEIDKLNRIVKSIKEEAEDAGVKIVCGDTKVVENGKCDGVYINTSGIGKIIRPIKGDNINDGDAVIVSGSIGEHGFAILNQRENLNLNTELRSDVSNLTDLILPLIESDVEIKFMRDPTRGGLAMCLNELCYKRDFGFEIEESLIPVMEDVRVISEILGIEPYYSANEGKMVIVVSKKDQDRALDILKKNPKGSNAKIIGKVSKKTAGNVILKTKFGSTRLLKMPVADKMPRIC
ncbi:hydrogenase expression/formation protein HypE [Hippea maritima]|uniref:Hydrogenase expression/formation protein HypE n=1 Tax=Hippea maritima (strain ATCC 700847 / DSM 10411 / MH2) TaxID=760142 RepID=F2LXP2_HIPMA|nr:hydrogenase expression/formation protein HypE [Hippea maritima]AEA34283.1 hydrogenase expression/formation protein HypE [Hippea maritima DSM 10411]